MKKSLIVLLSIVVLGAGGLLYYKWQQNQNLSVWSFVPSDAALVYQSNNLYKTWKDSKEKPVWQNLAGFQFLKNANEELTTLDSVFGAESPLESFLDNHELLLSAHLISKNSLGLLFVLSFDTKEDKAYLDKILEHLVVSGFKKSNRQYLGYEIIEQTKENAQFSYFVHNNFIVGSSTSFLVEDAIRVFDDSDQLDFKTQNIELFGLSKMEKDQGDLYINSKNLNDFVSLFTDPVKADVSKLGMLTNLSFLDLSINEESIILNGFSLNSAIKGNYLDSFDGVESSEFLMHQVVPMNTSTFFHFSFDDPEKWHNNLKNYWRKNSPELLTNMGELENKYEFPVKDLYGFLGNELGIITLESSAQNNDLIAFMHISDEELAMSFLNKLSDITNQESDSYSYEFKGYQVRQIAVDEMPMRFFGPLFSGFKSTFYTQIEDYVMMANSEVAMKDLIDNLEAENTWSKSLKMNSFLEIANKESNLSLYVNTKSALNKISHKLNDKWRPVIEENKDVLSNIEYAAAQFSNVDGKFYTNIVLQYADITTLEIAPTNIGKFVSQTNFGNEIITKPFGVRNHNDRSLEFVIQDESNKFYLISSANDILWNKALASEIRSEIFQVDYYKNRKLQYLFSTEKQIHIIDRTGTYIPGYPLTLPDNSNIKYLSLIDYDGSKDYRILAGTSNGQYFMFDKSGKNLEGWNPRKLNNEPNSKPIHLRIRNNDVLLFTNRNGTIDLLNRRGEAKKGFPLKLGGNIDEKIFIEKGASFSSTFLTLISEEGELIKLDLEAKVKERKQLFRNNTNDKFSLVISSDNRTFHILRKEDNKISILNAKGEEEFVHAYPVTNFSSQFYNFGSSHQVLVITDIDQELTFLYDINGNLLGGRPINTGKQIALLYQSATISYKIFLTYGKDFSVLNINR